MCMCVCARVYLALPGRVVDAQARVVGLGGGQRGGDAAQLAHGAAGRRRLLEVHERGAGGAVHAHGGGGAAAGHGAQHLLLRVLGEAVHPHAGGRHGLAEAELDARRAHVLAVHGADGLHHARDGRVLAEGVARAPAASLLYVDLYYSPEVLELIPQLLLRNILL